MPKREWRGETDDAMGLGMCRQCKRHTDLKQLCSSVRATPSKIPKQASCGLYKNSGSDEMRLMGDRDRIRSGTVRERLVEIGTSHQTWWNILREHNWGVPSAHIRFIYYVTYILECLIVLQGQACVQAHTQYYNCMRENYYSHSWSESVWSRVWALLGGNK